MSVAASPSDLIRARIEYPVVPFGYWRPSAEARSPLPWPDLGAGPDREFLEALAAVEAGLRRRELDGGVMSFMGRSESRLTGETLGNQEFFVHDDERRVRFVWPADYGPHYLAAGVEAPEPFRALIASLVARISATSCGASASRHMCGVAGRAHRLADVRAAAWPLRARGIGVASLNTPEFP